MLPYSHGTFNMRLLRRPSPLCLLVYVIPAVALMMGVYIHEYGAVQELSRSKVKLEVVKPEVVKPEVIPEVVKPEAKPEVVQKLTIQELLPQLKGNRRGFLRLILVDHKESNTKYAYCSLPKNGCSYHLGVIHRLFGAKDYYKLQVVHDPEALRGWQAFHQDDEVIISFFKPGIRRYAVVRNPVARTLSAYRNKIEPFLTEDEWKLGKISMFRRWVLEVFPSNVTRDELEALNVHWMPQTLQCGFKFGIQDQFKIFKFEDPTSYAEYMENVLPPFVTRDGWGANNTSLKEFVTGPRERSGNNEDIFWDYYSDINVFDHVVHAMKDDIDTFGYRQAVDAFRREIMRRSEE